MNRILLVLPVTLALMACEPVVKPDQETAPGAGAGPAGDSGGATVGTVGDGAIGEGASIAGKQYSVSYERGAIDDPNNILSQQVIYFDYDSSEIREEYVELVKHHGKYLALHSDINIRLEGHTDERGTREYNIALADRRAQAVKRMLTFQGASSDQVTIISYGEEKPAVFGQDEESWSLNRRAELVYLNK